VHLTCAAISDKGHTAGEKSHLTPVALVIVVAAYAHHCRCQEVLLLFGQSCRPVPRCDEHDCFELGTDAS
jgi:hypothetical protein